MVEYHQILLYLKLNHLERFLLFPIAKNTGLIKDSTFAIIVFKIDFRCIDLPYLIVVCKNASENVGTDSLCLILIACQQINCQEILFKVLNFSVMRSTPSHCHLRWPPAIRSMEMYFFWRVSQTIFIFHCCGYLVRFSLY